MFTWGDKICENCKLKNASWLSISSKGIGICSPALRYGKYYIEIIAHSLPSSYWFGLIHNEDPTTLQKKDVEVLLGSDGAIFRNGSFINNTNCHLKSGDKIGFAVDMEKKQCTFFLNGVDCGAHITDLIGKHIYVAVSSYGANGEYEKTTLL